MRSRAKQTLVLWSSILCIGGLVVFVLSRPTMRDWMWQQTGEEAFLAQVKGLSDLAGDLLRPRLALAADAPIQHADVNPFGVNTFLEQEAEPAKREQACAWPHDAGFHWLRQEFPGRTSKSTARAISRIAATSPIARPGRSTTGSSIWPSRTAWS
jgi:hypothetical protein